MDGLIIDSERIVQRAWDLAGPHVGIENMGEYIYPALGMNRKRREQY